MGQVTSARTSDTFEGTFECRACGFEAPALVHASGQGRARGWGEPAARDALADAAEDAGDVASWTLAFLPCPSCGRRDPIARSYVVSGLVLAVLAGAGGAALFAAIAFSRRLFDGQELRLGALATGVLVALLFFGAKARAFLGIRKRVTLDMSRATGVPPATIVQR